MRKRRWMGLSRIGPTGARVSEARRWPIMPRNWMLMVRTQWKASLKTSITVEVSNGSGKGTGLQQKSGGLLVVGGGLGVYRADAHAGLADPMAETARSIGLLRPEVGVLLMCFDPGPALRRRLRKSAICARLARWKQRWRRCWTAPASGRGGENRPCAGNHDLLRDMPAPPGKASMLPRARRRRRRSASADETPRSPSQAGFLQRAKVSCWLQAPPVGDFPALRSAMLRTGESFGTSRAMVSRFAARRRPASPGALWRRGR